MTTKQQKALEHMTRVDSSAKLYKSSPGGIALVKCASNGGTFAITQDGRISRWS